jgi:hypothetical protein
LHLQTKRRADALSTVEAEIADNLHFVVEGFRQKTGCDPIIVMDNIKIQANIPDDWIDSRYDSENLPPGCRIRIPTYSPDFNQVAEHFVACVKEETKSMMYARCCTHPELTGRGLQWMVEQVMFKIKRGELYNGSVARNVMRMPFVWQVIASSVDTVLTDPRTGAQYKGTAGDWAPPGLN